MSRGHLRMPTLLTSYDLLLATYYLLLTTHYVLRTTYYLLLTTYYLLLTTTMYYYLLPSTGSRGHLRIPSVHGVHVVGFESHACHGVISGCPGNVYLLLTIYYLLLTTHGVISGRPSDV